MAMRDGMPGPGWWIASDGRWYPPELHPDVRAPAAVIVEEPAPTHQLSAAPQLSPPLDGSPPPQLAAPSPSVDTSHTVSNGAEHLVLNVPSRNGTQVATRGTPAATPPARRPPRSLRQRVAIGVGLAAGSLALIAYFARGHDVRPSLETSANTTAPTTTVQGTPASQPPASQAPASQPPASQAPATSAGSSAPSTTARPGTTPATSVTSAAKITPRVVSVFDLVKGNCLDGPGLSDGLVTTIRVVDCSEVHTHEVYYSGRYPESTFDATRLSNYANDTCLAQFRTYVGIEYERSRYQYLHIVPTQDSWTRDNDRDVVCVAFDEDTTITGSIAGRAQ